MFQGTSFGNFLGKVNSLVAPVGINTPARAKQPEAEAIYEDDEMSGSMTREKPKKKEKAKPAPKKEEKPDTEA